MMISFETELKETISEALKTLYGIEAGAEGITLQETKKEFEGDVTLVVFPFIAGSKKSPEATATEIGNFVQQKTSLVSSVNVVKGFLNITIGDGFWKSFFTTVFSN